MENGQETIRSIEMSWREKTTKDTRHIASEYSQPTIIMQMVNTFSSFVFDDTFPKPTLVMQERV